MFYFFYGAKRIRFLGRRRGVENHDLGKNNERGRYRLCALLLRSLTSVLLCFFSQNSAGYANKNKFADERGHLNRGLVSRSPVVRLRGERLIISYLLNDRNNDKITNRTSYECRNRLTFYLRCADRIRLKWALNEADGQMTLAEYTGPKCDLNGMKTAKRDANWKGRNKTRVWYYLCGGCHDDVFVWSSWRNDG